MPDRSTILMLATTLLVLAACSNGTPQLMNLRNTETGPDEFSVVPTRELELPSDRAQLPPPTPGGINRADPTPEADAIAALGGNAAGGAPASPGLIDYASRFGRASDIRTTLAAEDLEFRSRNNGRILERMFGSNVYFRAYERQSLDRYAELERLRRAGVQTPTAPPPE